IAQDLLPTESNFGITQEMYSGLNNRDAKAGIEIWAKMIYENYTNIKKSNVIIYENMESLIKSINNNELDIVFLNSLQFIQNKDELKIQPYFGTTVNKEKKYSIYLISKNKQPIKKFDELKNTIITIQAGRYKMLNELWLDLLCLENRINDKTKFFKKIVFEENPSKTIFSVFFDKSDFCIATNFSYDLMMEMNPQISKKISVFKKRENLINDLFCFVNSMNPNLKSNLLDFGQTLDKQPKMEQVYKMFKIDGSYLLEEHYLDSTLMLWQEYNKIKKVN
ncbi:MAG: PhnD/SsuA/transferrin family substrate-binding protein, partial [Ignavibacteriae bacterium]|nr:PhnD/SsuA/transferrin family substrate-binding protein [Ignavibacteriota bacterium]